MLGMSPRPEPSGMRSLMIRSGRALSGRIGGSGWTLLFMFRPPHHLTSRRGWKPIAHMPRTDNVAHSLGIRVARQRTGGQIRDRSASAPCLPNAADSRALTGAAEFAVVSISFANIARICRAFTTA